VSEQSHSGDGLRRWTLIGLGASVVIVLAVPLYLVKERIAGGGAAGMQARVETFVGRESCLSCHEVAYQAWSGSDHDKAMDVASDSTVLGHFDGAVFEHRGVTSEFYRRDGKYYVRTEGPDGDADEFEIAYTFGVDPLQQYLIRFPGGRLQALSTAWNVVRGEWFHLYPGQDIPSNDWLHWTRGAQNWNGMCAECHSTNLVKGYDPATKTFETTWSEIDVSCEACHGPGSRHVAWAELPPMARPPSDDYELVIPSSDITARQQVELCAPCHSRRTELGDYDHRRMDLLDSQLPAVLREGLYHPDGQILEEVYVYGSFVQSKMYRNDVRCSDCHDVHSLELVEEGNQLCLQCHRGDAYDSYEHHFHQQVYQGEPSDGALCVKCHMVEQPYMVIDWRADHSLRVPRPDLTLEIGTPNACAQSGCHEDQSAQWSARYYRQWYGEAKQPHFATIIAAGREGRPEARDDLIRLAGDDLYPAIVRATALTLLASYPSEESTAAFNQALADEEPLLRHTALTSLNVSTAEVYVELVAPLLFDPVKAVRIEAASRLAGTRADMLEQYQLDALEETLAEYRETASYSLDFAFAGHNLGNLYARLGDAAQAERYYRSAIEIDDLFYPAKINLGMLYNSSGRNAEAERLFREVLTADPEQLEVAYLLGLLLAELDRLEEAVEYLGIASDGMPERARAHYNYGLALQAVGRPAGAETALLKALNVEPRNYDYLYALADHYVKRQQWHQALAVADRMIEAQPENRIGSDIRTLAEGELRRE
jgi:tetratricopeptide (TPR) repeat protein